MTKPKWIEDILAFALKNNYNIFSAPYGLINSKDNSVNSGIIVREYLMVENYLRRHPKICGEYFAAAGGNYYEVLRLAEAENNAHFNSTYDTIIIHHTSETREGEK